MNLEMQWMTLLWMLISGSALGVVFDSIRIVEWRYRFPRWSIHVLDLLYWVWAALYVFRTLYRTNEGELRLYVFLGLFLGVWIYFLCLSAIIEKFMVTLLKITEKIYLTSVQVFRILVIEPLRFAWKCAKLLFGFLWATLLFILRMLLPLWKLLRFLMLPLIRKMKLPEGWRWTSQKVRSLTDRWFTKK